MKIKIILGSILAIFIMIMLPTISAVQLDIVEKKMNSINSIIDSKFEELKLRYKNDPAEPTIIILLLLSVILNLLRLVKFGSILFVILLVLISRRNNNSSSVIN